MRVGVRVRVRHIRLKASRAARLLVPPLPALTSLEAKALAATWALAAMTTLGVALAQSLRMFLLSALAVLFGTLAALWMLDGMARR